MSSLVLPDGIRERVEALGPQTVDAAEWDAGAPTGRTERVTVWLEGRLLRSAPEHDAQALIAESAQRDADAQALRQKIVQAAQNAVGQSIDSLTAGQVRALVAVVLYQAGALDRDGVVQPLGEWAAP